MKHHLVANITNRPPWKSMSFWAYPGLCVVWIGTIILTIQAATGYSTARIKLSAAQIRFIDLIFSLPGLLICLTVLFAGISILRYARTIEGSKECQGFRYIAYGIFALLASLVIGSYISGIEGVVSRHATNPEHVKTTFVIITNYVTVVSYLITYGLLLRGTRELLRSIGRRLDLAKRLVPITAAVAFLAVGYLWLIYDNPVSQKSTDSNINPTYGLPYWLTVLTVALPFIVAWVLGALALMGMYEYREKTKGIVYKILFKKVVTGMTIFIGLTIALQLLDQLSSLYTKSNLSSLLALIIVIYLVLAYAFILMAQGAQKLNTIEMMVIE